MGDGREVCSQKFRFTPTRPREGTTCRHDPHGAPALGHTRPLGPVGTSSVVSAPLVCPSEGATLPTPPPADPAPCRPRRCPSLSRPVCPTAMDLGRASGLSPYLPDTQAMLGSPCQDGEHPGPQCSPSTGLPFLDGSVATAERQTLGLHTHPDRLPSDQTTPSGGQGGGPTAPRRCVPACPPPAPPCSLGPSPAPAPLAGASPPPTPSHGPHLGVHELLSHLVPSGKGAGLQTGVRHCLPDLPPNPCPDRVPTPGFFLNYSLSV